VAEIGLAVSEMRIRDRSVGIGGGGVAAEIGLAVSEMRIRDRSVGIGGGGVAAEIGLAVSEMRIRDRSARVESGMRDRSDGIRWVPKIGRSVSAVAG
jgi:hypothetical protein